MADILERLVLGPLAEDPERYIEEQRRLVATRFFLRRFNEHRPGALDELYEEWTRSGRGLSLNASWVEDWTERHALPTTAQLQSELEITLARWQDWTRAGLEPPLKWSWDACRPPPGAEPDAKSIDHGPPLLGTGPVKFEAPGWQPRESREAFRARVVKALQEHLSEVIKAADELSQALGNEDALLDRSSTRSQLSQLAEYQATKDLSMSALAQREGVATSTVRYRLHRAAELIGLPRERLNRASGTAKKRA